MAMTRKQKSAAKESRAEILRLNGIITAMQESIDHLTGTNDVDATEGAISSTVLMSQRVDPDTAPAETGPREDDFDAAEGSISPTVSMSQRVDPDTVQAETSPRNNVNSGELTTHGVALTGTTPHKDIHPQRESSLQQT
jgi:hypothetical protein